METLTALYSIIRYDFIVGFVVYSILFSVIKHFISKSSILFEFDIYACKVLMILVYGLLLLYILEILSIYLNYEDRIMYSNGSFNPFYGNNIYHLILVLLVQLFRIKKLRLSIVFRILIGVPLIVTFEQYIIIVTSIHRGHIPSTWQNITYGDVFIGVVLKMSLFLILTSLAFFSIRYYLSQKNQPHQ